MDDRRRVHSPGDADAAEHLISLIRRIGDADRAAFEELYRCTSAKLFGVCARILPTRQEAEEVLQETYLTVWRRSTSFDPARGAAMTWLISLAHHRSIDRLRARKPRAMVTLDNAAQVADPEPLASESLAELVEQDRAISGLDQLEPADAAFIRAAFLEGLSYPDLATRSGLPLGTVKSRIRRALLKLRAQLS